MPRDRCGARRGVAVWEAARRRRTPLSGCRGCRWARAAAAVRRCRRARGRRQSGGPRRTGCCSSRRSSTPRAAAGPADAVSKLLAISFAVAAACWAGCCGCGRRTKATGGAETILKVSRLAVLPFIPNLEVLRLKAAAELAALHSPGAASQGHCDLIAVGGSSSITSHGVASSPLAIDSVSHSHRFALICQAAMTTSVVRVRRAAPLMLCCCSWFVRVRHELLVCAVAARR